MARPAAGTVAKRAPRSAPTRAARRPARRRSGAVGGHVRPKEHAASAPRPEPLLRDNRRRKPGAPRRVAAIRVALAPGGRLEPLAPAAILDRLLRGHGWVLLIGVLLGGIVFLNVSLLGLNAGIAGNNERLTDLKRDNSRLRLNAARLGSSERIEREANARGLYFPAPGEVRYVTLRRRDASLAAARMRSPDPIQAIAQPAVAQVPTAPLGQAPPVLAQQPPAQPPPAAPPQQQSAPPGGATAAAGPQPAGVGAAPVATARPPAGAG